MATIDKSIFLPKELLLDCYNLTPGSKLKMRVLTQVSAVSSGFETELHFRAIDENRIELIIRELERSGLKAVAAIKDDYNINEDTDTEVMEEEDEEDEDLLKCVALENIKQETITDFIGGNTQQQTVVKNKKDQLCSDVTFEISYDHDPPIETGQETKPDIRGYALNASSETIDHFEEVKGEEHDNEMIRNVSWLHDQQTVPGPTDTARGPVFRDADDSDVDIEQVLTNETVSSGKRGATNNAYSSRQKRSFKQSRGEYTESSDTIGINNAANPQDNESLLLLQSENRLHIACEEDTVLGSTDTTSDPVFSIDHITSEEDVITTDAAKTTKNYTLKLRLIKCALCSKRFINLYNHVRESHTDSPEYESYLETIKNDHPSPPIKSAGAGRKKKGSKNKLIKKQPLTKKTPKKEKLDAISNIPAATSATTTTMEDCIDPTTPFGATAALFRKSDPNYECQFCPRKFTLDYSLYKHLIGSHSDQNIADCLATLDQTAGIGETWNCPYCLLMLHSFNSLKFHVSKEHSFKGEDSYLHKCTKCDVIVKTNNGLMTHMRRSHAIKEPCSSIKKKRRQYDPENLVLAYNAVKRDKMPTQKAAQLYGVPISTLKDRVLGRISIETTRSGPAPALNRDQEAEIAGHLADMMRTGCGYKRKQVISLASEYAVTLGIRDKGHPFSKQWYENFMKRFPELRNVQPVSGSGDAARGQNTNEDSS